MAGRALTVGGPGSADETMPSICGACRVLSSVTAETLRRWKAHVSVTRLTSRGRQTDGYIHHLTCLRFVLPRAVETARRKVALLCDSHKDVAEAQCFFSFLTGHLGPALPPSFALKVDLSAMIHPSVLRTAFPHVRGKGPSCPALKCPLELPSLLRVFDLTAKPVRVSTQPPDDTEHETHAESSLAYYC